ncbi:MAG: flagellar basal body-associated protein FliL [Pseudohongiellaceae bacterium]
MANFPSASRTLIWLVALLIVVLSLLSVANLYLLLDSRDAEETADEAAEETEVQRQNPIFVNVGPMTVNLGADEYGQRLLYAGLSLRVADEETQEQLTTHMPEIHSRLLILLSSHSASELTAPDGKEELASDILALFDEPLAPTWPPPSVEAVFFTDFIVQ